MEKFGGYRFSSWRVLRASSQKLSDYLGELGGFLGKPNSETLTVSKLVYGAGGASRDRENFR